jgi:radical SAM superfamily enzyme YgiQ (UPF0313 family)
MTSNGQSADVLLVMPSDPVSLAYDLSPPLQALGIGYLGAYLHANGCHVTLLDAHLEGLSPEAIAAVVERIRPAVLGFSVQSRTALVEVWHILKSMEARELRVEHLTLGGHFATVSDQAILERLPEIDSIVRGEGEEALLEIAKAVIRGKDWRTVEGISYTHNGHVIGNPSRKAPTEIDRYPFPFREYSFQSLKRVRGILSIVSSRGCWGACSFSASKQLQAERGRPIWRPRSPKAVADEVQLLVEKYNADFIQFVDDCFLGTGHRGSERAAAIAKEILARDLKVRFSIEARSDTVARSSETLALLKESGLAAVTLGVESGVDRTLRTFNKQTSVGTNMRAIKVLKNVGLRTTIGFIFFDPYCTPDELYENLQFLQHIKEIDPDIGLPPCFTELLIFEGTPIKEQLEADGLLRGDWQHDYTYVFADKRATLVYDLWKRFETIRPNILNPLVDTFGLRIPLFDLKSRLLDAWDFDTMNSILSFVETYGAVSEVDLDTFLSELFIRQEEKLRYALVVLLYSGRGVL